MFLASCNLRSQKFFYFHHKKKVNAGGLFQAILMNILIFFNLNDQINYFLNVAYLAKISYILQQMKPSHFNSNQIFSILCTILKRENPEKSLTKTRLRETSVCL